MGSFIEVCKKVLKWVGDCINKVIKWFDGVIRKTVMGKTEDFVKKKETVIMSANDPKKVGKVIAQKKALIELEKIAEQEKKDLSRTDQDLVDKVFAEDDYI